VFRASRAERGNLATVEVRNDDRLGREVTTGRRTAAFVVGASGRVEGDGDAPGAGGRRRLAVIRIDTAVSGRVAFTHSSVRHERRHSLADE
jgi:hypothetical protein